MQVFRSMRRSQGLAVAALACLPALLASPRPASAQSAPAVQSVDQWKFGTSSVEDWRKAFYSQDQGSQIMPLAWFLALKQPDGRAFLADGLARFGYLPNPYGSAGLPVGFTAAGAKGSEFVGMTCAACHTRQIVVSGTSYRIDGGPALADFQSFLRDLDTAVAAVRPDKPGFPPFAAAVLGPDAEDETSVLALGLLVEGWYARYHTLMDRALPDPAWGPGRLDAVGMIFNRLTGLDIGPPDAPVIPENIHKAIAPARYPFLWNAPIQDRTQWPGFADNGDDILALPRNLGEVFGVFAAFQPRKERLWWDILGYDYLGANSANFPGLLKLEDLVRQIGAPRWPQPAALDKALVEKGRLIFASPDPKVNCQSCHGIRPGKPRLLNPNTWATPVYDTGTDTAEHTVMDWTVSTGVLAGAQNPLLPGGPLKAQGERAFNVLANAVLGSIIQEAVPPWVRAMQLPPLGSEKLRQTLVNVQSKKLQQLKGAFPDLDGSDDPCKRADAKCYESRVLEGIWAAAPYLHNGSVASLEELLRKPAERKTRFKIGPNYDLKAVGLAEDQPTTEQVLETGCAEPAVSPAGTSGGTPAPGAGKPLPARNSGNSNCGHDFGTELSPDQKRALLEYLKTL